MMTDETPYHERPMKEIAQEVACMRTIFRKAKPVPLIYEAFGGIGATAVALQELFPGARLRAFDIDAKCCAMYNRATGSDSFCFQMDATEGLDKVNPPPGFGAVMDFNRFTIMDLTRPAGLWKRKLIDQVAVRQAAWFELTDSAVCYLGTNYRRYGLAEKSLRAYVDKLKVEIQKEFGYNLLAWDAHRAATYMLFGQGH